MRELVAFNGEARGADPSSSCGAQLRICRRSGVRIAETAAIVQGEQGGADAFLQLHGKPFGVCSGSKPINRVHSSGDMRETAQKQTFIPKKAMDICEITLRVERLMK